VQHNSQLYEAGGSMLKWIVADDDLDQRDRRDKGRDAFHEICSEKSALQIPGISRQALNAEFSGWEAPFATQRPPRL
jgi:hypothetical protein